MNNKDKSIQIIRIISMILIVVCHIASQSNISIIKMSAQFFSVGVFIFLFISGFLYGKKEIQDIKKFYKGRIIKVLLPIYIFIVILYIITFIKDKSIDVKYIFIYLFNLQFILGGMRGANHLWFITIIVMCYIVTPLISKYKLSLIKNKNIILIILIILSIVTVFINEKISKTILYFVTYLLGYIFGNKDKVLNTKISIIICILGIVIRLLGRKIFDETFIYNIFITFFTQIMISISIFSIIKNFYSKRLWGNEKLINYFDEYSFYIYITHYMFFEGPLKIMSLTNNFILNVIIALILTYIASVILHYIYGVVNKKCLKI